MWVNQSIFHILLAQKLLSFLFLEFYLLSDENLSLKITAISSPSEYIYSNPSFGVSLIIAFYLLIKKLPFNKKLPKNTKNSTKLESKI
jgi:hypothetical protein